MAYHHQAALLRALGAQHLASGGAVDGQSGGAVQGGSGGQITAADGNNVFDSVGNAVGSAAKSTGGFFSDVGHWFGKATGAEGFQTDPAAYNLPQLQQQQDYTHANSQSALGTSAPTLDQSQANQFRGDQSQLASMLMNQANGRGPSVAQQQLNRTTQNNIAQAFALSQGHPNNPAAIRNAVNQAGNVNQEAAGQGALLRAQETLNAQAQLGNVLQGARGQDLGAAGQNAQLQQSQFGLDNTAALGWNAQNQAANQGQQQGQIAQQQIAENAYAAQQGAAQRTLGGLIGGVASGIEGMAMAYEGGEIPAYADGGAVGLDYGSARDRFLGPQDQAAQGVPAGAPRGPMGPGAPNAGPARNFGGQPPPMGMPQGMGVGPGPMGATPPGGPMGMVGPGKGAGVPGPAPWVAGGPAAPPVMSAPSGILGMRYADGGSVPGYAVGGPVGLGYFGISDPKMPEFSDININLKRKGGSGAVVPLGPSAAPGGSLDGAGDFSSDDVGELLAAHGGGVPGRAETGGNSPRNDTVPAMLSPGEVVLPRSVTKAPDAPDKAAQFMEAVEKNKAPRPTFKDVLESHRNLHQRLARLEGRP